MALTSDFDLARRLFGTPERVERQLATSAQVVRGRATADSGDGVATVVLDADAEGATAEVEVPTSNAIEDGDEVLVTIVNGSPVECVSAGSGDRMAAAVQDAHDLAASVEGIAQEAKEVAEATGQHFWPDTDGVHVTEVTQDEWNDSTGTSYHSGANVLLNALGQLFRDGLNNILAIVSGTDPGVAIYDGEGNAADNIMALFSKALIRIGGRLLGTGTSTASVQFFQSDASQTDIKATHTVGSTTPPTGPDDVYGIEHNVRITTTTDDSELDESRGYSGWAQLDLTADVNPDYEQGSAMLRARVFEDDEFSDSTPALGVLRQIARSGVEAASVYMAAPTLEMHDIARYKTGRVPMEQAIAALTTPLYSNQSSVSITRANTDTTGASVTVPAGAYILVVAYTFPTASGSGTRSLAIGAKAGGSTLYNTSVEGSRAAVRKSMFEVMHLSAQTTVTALFAKAVVRGSRLMICCQQSA